MKPEGWHPRHPQAPQGRTALRQVAGHQRVQPTKESFGKRVPCSSDRPRDFVAPSRFDATPKYNAALKMDRLQTTTYFLPFSGRCVEIPVSITTVRQIGDFGRQPLDRRKTPSPTPTGVYRVFSDRAWGKSCLAAHAQSRSFSLYAHDPETCRSSHHQIPVFPCPAGNFGKTQLGSDIEKAARSATMKPLPHHAFPAGPSFVGKDDCPSGER